MVNRTTPPRRAQGQVAAVRLPKEFRVLTNEVFIRKDQATGDIVLSTRPPVGAWSEFFTLRAKTRIPADFLICENWVR
jgi:antitoxin VapB